MRKLRVTPETVQKEGIKKEDENFRFRTYLKNNAELEELDEHFHRLHNEIFTNYDCSKCRNCCKLISGEFNENEVKVAAQILEVHEEDLIKLYFEKTGRDYQVKATPCSFFENNECKLNDCKPNLCKEYPFTQKDERIFSLLSVVNNASICPVVYEIVEELKDIYHFRRKR